MAKLIYASNVSLDGCTEDERGPFDWATPDDDVFAFITDVGRAPSWHHAIREVEKLTGGDNRTGATYRVTRELAGGRIVGAPYPLARYEEASDTAADAGVGGAGKVAFALREAAPRRPAAGSGAPAPLSAAGRSGSGKEQP